MGNQSFWCTGLSAIILVSHANGTVNLGIRALDAKDITAALIGEPIIRGDDDDPAPTTGTRSSVPTTGGVGPEPEPQNS
ncbi:hypothetical protein OAQ68_00615 [bacterium]|nr:hypothetical protein [bacterium]